MCTDYCLLHRKSFRASKTALRLDRQSRESNVIPTFKSSWLTQYVETIAFLVYLDMEG